MKIITLKLLTALLFLALAFNFSACTKVGDIVGAKYVNCTDITSTYIMSNHNPYGADYIVTCNLNILNGGHLIIEQGTTVQFAPTAGINVTGGRIEVKGTNGKLVTLERMADSPLTSWKGIVISSFDFNEIKYANIKGAKTEQGSAAIYTKARSSSTIKNCVIEDTGCGIFSEFLSTPIVMSNTYLNVGNGHCEEF